MLSVCLIARNEEKSLPRALKSVREVADEIIVADTGSTDGTVKVAQELGAPVFHFPWCEDFSAARNFAISHARGDWIFWLDADEELLPESVRHLRECIARPEALAYLVLRQDLTDVSRLDHFTSMWQLRLFRRRDDLKFLGRCHPHFVPDIHEIAAKEKLNVWESPVIIRHYGYVGELLPAKLRRGARLLELELRERPGQLYYLVEYGRTLLRLGDEQRGHEILCDAMRRILPLAGEKEVSEPTLAPVLEYFLLLPPERFPKDIDVAVVNDLAQRWFPSFAPLVWLRARRAAEAGQFAEAEQLLRRLVQMGKDHSYDKWISFAPEIIGSSAKLNLGVCLVRQGKVKQANEVFTELLNSDRAAEAREYLNLIQPLGGTNYSFA